MSDGDRPSDRFRERIPRSRRWLWVVLDADRRLVASGLLVVLFGVFVAASWVFPGSAYSLLLDDSAHRTLFNALVAATITSVTLVLTLSQLVLSQELGAVGDQRERMSGSLEFRADAADAIGTHVAPAEPSAFLRELVTATRDQAETLDDTSPGGDAGDAIGAYVDNVARNAETVSEQLEGAKFGEFDVVWAALNYNYSWKLYAGERLRADHGDALSANAHAALDDLLATLELFGPAREHVKTLYFQWALSNLSRTILYAAVPALGVSVATLLFFDPAAFAGRAFGVNHAVLVVSAAATVALLPFALLLAYILRIVTVAKRTLSIGPFVLRETDRETGHSE